MNSKLHPIVRLFLIVDLAILVLIILVAGVGWLLGWRTTTEFSNGFFIVGSIFAVLGAYTGLGGFGMRGNPGVNIARTASPAGIEERNRQMLAEWMQGNNATVLMVSLGMALIGIAILIPNLFG